MKGTLRKMASVILIMAMVLTSVSLDGLQVSAASKKPTKITLNAKSKTLTVGKSFQLKVKSVKPKKASKAVTYKSSNKKVATVSSKGKIKAKKAGKTTITVTSKTNKRVKATCKIVVKSKAKPTKKPVVTKKPTATPSGDGNYGDLHNPITDKNGNVTYSCIYFGNYPQSDATGETKEPIKWRVLSINGNDAFLVADQNLDVMEYNKKYKAVTWETCTMRSWLNGYGSGFNIEGIDYSSDNFIDRAFNSTEQAAILTTNVVNDDNPEYGTEGGNNTLDKIFLLSIDEVSNSAYGFLPYEDADTSYVYDKARQRTNTAYVNNGGIIQSSWMRENAEDYVKVYGGYWWWLRSPGDDSGYAAYVYGNGDVTRMGSNVLHDNSAVCPALHINLSSSSTWRMADSVTIYR